MEFFKIRRVIPFMRHALVFNAISLVTFLAAVFFLATQGLNFSVEFTGGTLLEVSYQQAAEVEKIREALEKSGFKAEVQNFGSSRDVLLRMPIEKGQSSSELSQKVIGLLKAVDPSAELRRVELVGAPVVANLHDVIIILGFFSFFQWDFSLPVLAAVLAVLGYSVNESVIVFDRVRENFRKLRRASTAEGIDPATTGPTSRTIIAQGCPRRRG